MTTTTGLVLLITVVMVIATLAWYLARERRSRHPGYRFGPEYEHVMRRYGDRPKAGRG
jgi:hypothetical protein